MSGGPMVDIQTKKVVGINSISSSSNAESAVIDQDMIQKIVSQKAQPVRDEAMQATPGGIDLNPNNLDLQTQGEGLKFNMSVESAELQNIDIDGFIPVIINIAPATNLLLHLGLVDKDKPNQDAQDKTSNDLTYLDLKTRFEP